jgi:hypothetical protein
MAVGRKVVAAQDRERRDAVLAPAAERLDEKPRSAAWARGGREVGNDIRVILFQSPGRRVVAVALFRDREADDAHRRIAHGADEGIRVFGRNQEVAHGTNDAQALPVAGSHCERIQPVLRRESIARVRRAQAGAADGPLPFPGGKAVVDVDGLVGAVESADPEMHDTNGKGLAIVARTVDVGREASEGGRSEAHQHS